MIHHRLLVEWPDDRTQTTQKALGLVGFTGDQRWSDHERTE
jgi:hypothetical protein